ncbi:MAG: ATP-dependent acyl-CoA ligase [Deltaproteobacteria bacterium]|nr:ATP-dependent acyl-CoA ligase [Deltaproteobacteria bacterium]
MDFKELLETRAGEIGESPFLYFRDQTVTFGELDRRTNRAANLLRELGIQKGDHVCLFLPNCPEFLYLWFGLAKIGGVMVPLNVSLRGDGLTYIINHCDAKWIVVDERLYDPYAFVEKDLVGIEKRVWHSDGGPAPDGFDDLDALMATADDNPPPTTPLMDGDPLGIIYTSGTTGPPKGAMISHFNYLNTGEVWAEDYVRYRDNDIFFTTLPLFHANAQMFTTMGSLYSGRPFVLRERFSASRFFDEIRQYGATIFNYIGGMLTMLMKQPEREDDSDNPARATFGGAAPKEIWEDLEKRFNVTIIEGYGLTESGGVCLCNPPDNIKVGSIGKPVRFCDVAIWDENNQEAPKGESAEIVVKEETPYSMFLGYYKQQDKTDEAWDGGWFHTGDRGYEDEDGYFYFLDRVKDCIRRRGENISSFDIEKIVNSHPGVLESAAVAVPSELGEDEVKIYVILQPDEKLEPEELLVFCEERMAYFMVPRYVEFIKAFPKTATERTQKFELRKLGIGDAWDREKAGYKLKRV